MLINQSRKVTITLPYSLIVLLSIFVVVGCNTSNVDRDETEQEEKIKVATVSNGEITPSVTNAELRNLSAKSYNDISEDRKVEGSFFNDVSIKGGGNHYYIVAKSNSADGNCVSVATKLNMSSLIASGSSGTDSEGTTTLLAGPNPETHTCEGDPCSDCDFTYETEEEEEIDGCMCDDNVGDGRCNHTVSSN